MNEQIKNIVLGIVVVVLIIGGVYYAKTKKAMAPDRVDDQEIPILNENNNFISNENENTLINQEENSETIDNKSSIAKENKLKFNTAMNNAMIAFGKGEYDKSIIYYNEALTFIKSDKAYSGLFITYGAKKDWANAKIAIDKAIELNSLNTDFWIWKMQLLDEQTGTSFIDLKKIYTDGLSKVDPKTKINLVTSFARIAENNGEIEEAIAIWGYAKEIYPVNSLIYQQEIDRLNVKGHL